MSGKLILFDYKRVLKKLILFILIGQFSNNKYANCEGRKLVILGYTKEFCDFAQ